MKVDRGVLAGVGVVVLWASAFPAIQVAAPTLGVIGLSFVRLLVATVVLLAVGAKLGVRVPHRRDLPWIAVAGFFGMFAYQLLLNASELFVPSGTASIIVAAAPLVSVAVARMLFREPISRFTILGSVLALSGVTAVCLARATVAASMTVLIVVAAMVVQGIYHPLQRPLTVTYSGLEIATYCMVVGTLLTAPLVPFGWHQLNTAPLDAWICAVYLGLLPSALGFVLWAVAVGRLPIATSTSLLYLVPPVTVLIAWVWLGEAPLVSEIVGGVIVIGGVTVIAQGSRIRSRICALRTARSRQRSAPSPVAAGHSSGPTHEQR
ncbi:DMT family transporter [Nocardioides insulae]|uniref:DMT family transporter n=1 Tax=Nocardioides insulae TaxID=394734 RepID=UPI0004036257|nr:DMT family transporter [Nocardioides insulae]